MWLIGIGVFWCIGMIVAIALCRAAGDDTSETNRWNNSGSDQGKMLYGPMSNAMRDLHQHRQEQRN